MSERPVIFDELACNNGKRVGVALLNSEKTLNSLSLPMIDLLMDQLKIWKSDDDIVLVILHGAGDRAFSAGGDIQDLYKSMLEHPGGPNPYADAFFEREYRLDYLIHTYPKPVLAWANGFVMGGGLGVMAASSHRVGTERSRIAMPEITIGLFPDAGATWFLAHIPTHLAHFLAWTGSHLNAVDARRVGFIDCYAPHDRKEQVFDAICDTLWTGRADEDRDHLTRLLEQFAPDEAFAPSILDPLDDVIMSTVSESLAEHDPVAAFNARLDGLDAGDKWLGKAIATFRSGSPTTAHIIPLQISRAQGLTLEQTFMLELAIAIQCSRHPDFAEGIRALLIDRDNQPRWHHRDLSSVPGAYVEEHFTLPGDRGNPLADLGE